MVFILNKLYVLLPYTYPTPKLSPHRRLCAFLDFQKKHHLVMFLSLLNYGEIGSVLINHLQIVIPLSYPCHYTNLCPHKPHKPAHTHTHTPHTHTHTHHTHTHTHTTQRFPFFVGTLHRRNGFYTVQTVFSIALHLSLPLTGNILLFQIFNTLHSLWFISLFSWWGPKKCPHKVKIYWYYYPCRDIWSS